MILFLDTSDFNGLHFALIDSGKKPVVRDNTYQVAYNENYKTAEFLQKFLRKYKTTPRQLSKIVACSGPGSFTGIRVGVALAQALGFALNIPVLALKKNQVPKDLAKLATLRRGKHIILHYGHKPNITKSKPR